MKPITVLVVDDHDLLREGVSACLSGFDDLEVVGEAGSGEAAISAVAELNPDVVVIDLVMPGIGGAEAIRQLRAGDAELGIVALSSFSDGNVIREVIEAGATGYLVKSVDADSLGRAVRSAASGQSTFSPEVTQALMKAPDAEAASPLTPREDQIADLIAEGRTNAEIANDLHLSIFTVKNHVSSILMKLAVRTRTEAASVILKSRQ
jgi:NarL family two-component system response regulator LiaR